MEKKAKGSEAELAVAARLVADGWHVLFPFGDYSRYDLWLNAEAFSAGYR